MGWYARVAALACSTGSRCWEAWPRPGSFAAIPRVLAADAPQPSPRARHNWRREGRGYRCLACCRRMDSLSVARLVERCPGASSRRGLRPVLADPKGHALLVCHPGRALPFLACMRCGSWADSRPVKLLRPCSGVPTAAGFVSRRRLASGHHPRDKTPLVAAYYIRGGAATDEQVQWS